MKDDLEQKRKNAVRTALLLAAIAVAIFITFIGTTILGR